MELQRLLERRSGPIHFKVLGQKDLSFCFSLKISFSVFVLAHVSCEGSQISFDCFYPDQSGRS